MMNYMERKHESNYPARYETTYTTPTGEQLAVRPIKPKDEQKLKEYFDSFNENDRYLRFFSPINDFGANRLKPFINIDYVTDMVLGCECTKGDERGKIVGGGGFFKTSDPSKAELSLSTRESWRNQGIAKFLLQYLIQIAQEQGYRQLVGYILFENSIMLHIIKNAGYPVEMHDQEKVVEFKLDIA